MNIMFLIFSFNMGGIERLLIDMSRGMVKRGNRVYLCVINKDYTASLFDRLDPSVEVILLDRAPGHSGFLSSMRRFAGIVKRHHIDILHCQGINCVLFAALAKLTSRHLTVLNTVHDTGNYPSYSDRKIALQNLFLDETIAISKSVETEILARHMDPRKVTTIYNAVDTELFPLREAVPHPDDPSRIEIGNVARFFPAKKGQDLLAEAVLLLLPEYPSIHVSFAGAVFKGQEEAYRALEEKIAAAGLSDHFTFLGNVDDVPAFLDTLDIFVLPSRYEGFGISLIEAMSVGLPSVASNLAGPSEIITDDSLGLLFTPDDAGALADALRRMLRERETFNPAHISASVAERFSMDTMVDRHLALYRRLREQ